MVWFIRVRAAACLCEVWCYAIASIEPNELRLHKKKWQWNKQEQEQNKPTKNRNYFANKFIDTVIYLA